ncbi:amidohydrolase family protein [Leucobacter luti]|uniref:Cytosine/adenosine deaminase-related metal-dependent hydrolase n=1 Tax=Leucobacter luti TaxID=340320 RepID=A0A4R6S4I5_9MICO|nr:amidohydrolase family protein [Leucobacter luti]QYM76506.1 amidohydrolase family protein [Leucobacter luti]TDP94659.1 cytosine/adenosine deaminase-related metal-dependent hydrolase [Leucobacter luti]
MSSTAAIVVYSAPLVFPVTSPRIVDGAVAVQGDRILHVGDRRWVREALDARGVEYREERWEGVIAPGLVNAHTHLQYTHMAEIAERRYTGFDHWGDAFDVVYERGNHNWAAAAAAGAAMSLAAGVTAAADVITDREALSALHDAGMHGIAYWEVYGKSNQDWDEAAREEVRQQIRSIPTPPGAGVSPHAPYSLEVQPLLELPDIVREEGLRLHIHLAEAHMEREFDGIDGYAGPAGHGEWPELAADSFRALRSHGIGVSSTQFVDHLGVLGPDCHIAHGVYVSAADRALLRARGTSVALCPRSNEVIGLDMPPVAAYLREGNQIAVGTDSLSSSPSLDLLADVAALYRVAREQGYRGDDLHQRLFGAATLGGAAALGLHVGKRRIGQLGVGALADLAFFATDSTDPDVALAELVEDGAGRARRTIVAGIERFASDGEPRIE